MTEIVELAGLDRSELGAWLEPRGAKRFTADQLYRWLYASRVADFDSMTNLSLGLRETLKRQAHVGFPPVLNRIKAGDDTTRYVYQLVDGFKTESVFIPARKGRATLCISSQIGCAMACGFCLSGAHGLKRNLSAAEILGQVWTMLNDTAPLDRTNIVFMGIGEPLDNFDTVMKALGFLRDPKGFNISLKRITVSTVGHVGHIERLAKEESRPRLAVSLNATSDEVRSRIMPINRAYPLSSVLIQALRAYPIRTNERITFEYVLLAGVNDSDDDARRLGTLIRNLPAKVNIIPWNPSDGLNFEVPPRERVERFTTLLERCDTSVTVRRRRGGDVAAACGQLSFRNRPVASESPEARA